MVTVYKQSNVDNINNIRREARRHFRNKQKGYLKSKFDEIETKSKIKNIRDLYRSISDFKKGYQSRTNIVKNENGDLFTDSHSILGRWRNHFSQLFNVHRVRDVRQREISTKEPLLPEPSAFELEMAIEKLKRQKSPSIDKIQTELIKAGGRTICYEIHKLINSI